MSTTGDLGQFFDGNTITITRVVHAVATAGYANATTRIHVMICVHETPGGRIIGR